MSDTVRSLFGIVRSRQIIDRVRHSLSFVPGLYVVAAAIGSQVSLLIDRALTDVDIPDFLTTTVDSSQAVFTALAGGLITSITLLLSMILVAVQLATTQFSPRTLREWLSDRFLQNTVGLTLGTTVFSLLAVRSTRSFGDDGGETVPHITVLATLLLGVASLIAVVRTVDHITHTLRVSSIADRISTDTIEVIRRQGDKYEEQHADADATGRAVAPVSDFRTGEHEEISDDAVAIESPTSGWIQQIDLETLMDALPAGSSATIAVPLGAYVNEKMPLIWVDPPPPDEETQFRLLAAVGVGDSRTLQEDIEFGLLQLTDVAVRALSPGINDPSTAIDVVSHLGAVITVLWEYPHGDRRIDRDDRMVLAPVPSRAQFLRRSIDPIRRYGSNDPLVLGSIILTLSTVASEVRRRNLVGDPGPLDDMMADVATTADRSGWSDAEIDEFDAICLR